MDYVFYILWAAPPVCLAVTIPLLLRRGVHRRLPFFCAYAGYLVVEFTVLFLVNFLAPRSRSPALFYRSFATVSLAISIALEFLVIFELLKELTLPHELAGKLGPVFRWVAALLVLSAAGVSARLLQDGAGPLVGVFQTLVFSANLVKLGLLLVVLACTIGLKIPWKSLPAGLALGFGIQSSVNLGASALYSVLGRPGFPTVDMIRMGAFLCCTIIWLVCIARREKPLEFEDQGLRVSELERIERQMQKMIRG
jgi:hypothetical protein